MREERTTNDVNLSSDGRLSAAEIPKPKESFNQLSILHADDKQKALLGRLLIKLINNAEEQSANWFETKDN